MEAEVLGDEFLLTGNALKAVAETDDELRVQNYIVLFDSRDLTGEEVDGFGTGNKNADGSTGEYFTEATEVESIFTKSGTLPIGWEHGEPIPGEPMIPHGLGYVDWKTAQRDANGWLVERILDRRNKFIQAIEPIIRARKIGTSSEAHKSVVANDGRIEQWPLVGDTLTVKPFEPRMLDDNPVLMKSVKELAKYDSRLKAMLPETDGTSVEQHATESDEVEQENAEAVESKPQSVEIDVNLNASQNNNSNGELEMSTEQVQENVTEEAVKAPAVGSDGATQTVTQRPANFNLNDNQLKAIIDGVSENLRLRDEQETPDFSKAGFVAPQKSIDKGINYNKTRRGDSEAAAIAAWARTGDGGTYGKSVSLKGQTLTVKASNDTGMNITTAADGGNAVPTGHFQGIIARRDESMLAAQLGVRNIPGQGTTVNVPIDSEADGEFVSTSEQNDANSNNFDRDAPSIGTVAMTLVKYTKKVELTDELLQDEDSRLMAFLEDFVGRGMAKTHNSLLLTEVLANGTAGVTAAGAAAITAGEVVDLEYALADEYADDDAAWITRRATEGVIRKLQGDQFIFQSTPHSSGVRTSRSINGYPVFNSAYMPSLATGNKTVAFGNFTFVGKREAPSFTLLRDPYSVDGKVILKYYFRTVYKVLQAEAIQYLTQA